jgi:F0F1-type ATP synthase assembly protein I
MPFHRAIPEQKRSTDSSSGFKSYVEAEKLIHLAFVLPAAVFIGLAAGWWGDQRLHQSWMAFAGIILGSIAGLYYVIQQAIFAEKDSRKHDSTQNGTGKDSSHLEP